jgi:hypothetical protein
MHVPDIDALYASGQNICETEMKQISLQLRLLSTSKTEPALQVRAGPLSRVLPLSVIRRPLCRRVINTRISCSNLAHQLGELLLPWPRCVRRLGQDEEYGQGGGLERGPPWNCRGRHLIVGPLYTASTFGGPPHYSVTSLRSLAYFFL